jgi:8-oxo-dGTP diphosphatase
MDTNLNQSIMRNLILQEIELIEPLDLLEQSQKEDSIAWVLSGAELCRIEKPATPRKHLVSYFVVWHDEQILLVDHKNAQLWLPPGGHVEPGEHPRQCVAREAQEELGLQAQFLFKGPLFITCTETVGLTAGHVDVSLWYVLQGDKTKTFVFDVEEFSQINWFDHTEIPWHKCDPHLSRFMKKLRLSRQVLENSV